MKLAVLSIVTLCKSADDSSKGWFVTWAQAFALCIIVSRAAGWCLDRLLRQCEDALLGTNAMKGNFCQGWTFMCSFLSAF